MRKTKLLARLERLEANSTFQNRTTIPYWTVKALPHTSGGERDVRIDSSEEGITIYLTEAEMRL